MIMKENRVFKRKIYSKLLEWKQEEDGKSAILVKGARRIGKSTIVEEFARNEYKSYMLVDFSEASLEVKSLFNDLMDLNYIFLRLQAIYNVVLENRKSVIIFDEVQECPLARQAIKTLVKDHRYDYIETGSLISIRKNTENIIIPSEETSIEMYPMDYEEFRWALGDEATVPLLNQFYEKRMPLEQALRKSMRDFRLYMLIGGMPQAVNEYLNTNNLSRVDKEKRKIINLYLEDFLKIDPSVRASRLFRAIPSELSKNASRYQVGSVLNDSERKNLDEVLEKMRDSMTVNFAYHSNDPNVGLSLNCDMSQYKMFVGDTGLFVTLTFWDKDVTENVIYEKLLNDKLPANLGYVYENIVAQMLTAKGNKLFYHTWPTESGKHNYEVDFLLSRGTKIWPLEIKSSGYKSHVSLDAFCKKYSDRIGERFLVYTKDYCRDKETTLLPVLMTMFL
ncbi:MAG: ATP-binding protein [Bacteroidaceae bacterium]|nr:ATP-binding protein [Bacteroidaceae bacterium]